MSEENPGANPPSPHESYAAHEVLSKRVESLLVRSEGRLETIRQGLATLYVGGVPSAVARTAIFKRLHDSVAEVHADIVEAKGVVANRPQLSDQIDQVNWVYYQAELREAENQGSPPSCEDDIPF